MASARDLYASHLVEGAKTSARPPMAGSASLNIGAGHFLSQPRKQGAAVPATLAEAARRAGAVPTGSDTARSAASRARRRRRHRNRQLQAVQGMLASSSGGRVRGSGKRAASVISAASGASLGGYSVASSTASRVHGMAHSVSDTLLSYEPTPLHHLLRTSLTACHPLPPLATPCHALIVARTGIVLAARATQSQAPGRPRASPPLTACQAARYPSTTVASPACPKAARGSQRQHSSGPRCCRRRWRMSSPSKSTTCWENGQPQHTHIHSPTCQHIHSPTCQFEQQSNNKV